MIFLLFLLAGIGLTSIIVDSEFTSGLKMQLGEFIKRKQEILGEQKAPNDLQLQLMNKLYYMLWCLQCSGFWVGLVLGFFIHPMGNEFSGWSRILEAILCAGAISYVAQVGMALFNYLNVEYGSKS